jgi:hypothetical protein
MRGRESPSDLRDWIALLDPQIAREPWIVAAHVLDEPLSLLAPDERLDGVTKGTATGSE